MDQASGWRPIVGAVHFHLDTALVTALQAEQPFSCFVETGTFQGDTVEAMRTRFPLTVSIELSQTLHAAAHERFREDQAVRILHGDSPALLRQLSSQLSGPVLYYLDAHWCVATDTAGQTSQCPLLHELAAIGCLNGGSVVLIDDARLFLATPGEPHEVSQWPSFQEILEALRSMSPHHQLAVVNDVIAFFPPHLRGPIVDYARHHGLDWLHAAQSLAARDLLHADLQAKEKVIKALSEGLESRDLEIEKLKKASALLENQRQKEPRCGNQERPPQTASAEDTPVDTKTDARWKDMESALARKEEVIQELHQALQAYRAWMPILTPAAFLRRWGRLVKKALYPKLGRLYHHPPIPARLPTAITAQASAQQLPIISIVTPSFRQARFLERTITSVLEQAYPRLEYFVQDGGSDDGSADILKRYASRLDGWVSAPDGGQSQAINAGFLRTSGEVMAWLNSDDLLLPGALATVGQYFSSHPEVDVVYGHRILIDEEDREIGRWVLPAHSNETLSWADFIPQETMFWRRRLWDKVGGIDESFRFAMDWDLLLRFRDAGARMVRLPNFLGAFRIHEAQKTSAAIHEVGLQEMARLRLRALGREVSYTEIRRALVPYMLRHVGCDIAFRLRRRLAGKR